MRKKSKPTFLSDLVKWFAISSALALGFSFLRPKQVIKIAGVPIGTIENEGYAPYRAPRRQPRKKAKTAKRGPPLHRGKASKGATRPRAKNEARAP